MFVKARNLYRELASEGAIGRGKRARRSQPLLRHAA